MHASGHALLAAAGGGLARALAGGVRDPGSVLSMDPLGRLGGADPLLTLALCGLTAAVAKTIGGALGGWAEARVAGDVGEEVRREVLDGVLARDGLRAPRHGDHGEAPAEGGDAARHTAEDLARLTTHVAEVERGVSVGVLGEVRGIVQLVPLVVLLVWLAPRLAGSAALAMSGFAFLVLGTRRALKRAHARAARDAAALLGASDEAVRHADLWVTYGATAKIRRHLAKASERIVSAQARLRAHGALVSGTSEVLGAVALVLVVALAGRGALGGVDRATLVPFAVAFFMAYRPLRDVVEARIARARGEAALAAALEASGGREASAAPEPGARGAWPLGDLVVEGLVGRHGRHAPLSARIAAGSVVAIVGPTGIGKTSLVRALLGLERPARGAVRYAGVDLDDQPPGPVTRPFAWVPQDAPLLAATLEENVALGAREEDVDEGPRVAACLGRLGATTLAASIGSGETLVVGRVLSGGERQLVALARALATELPVLLLDEPTSALDAASQDVVLGALASLRGKCTILVVTHRPEPLAIADVVLRLAAVERDDAHDGAGEDLDLASADEVSVDDPGAVRAGERQPRV